MYIPMYRYANIMAVTCVHMYVCTYVGTSNPLSVRIAKCIPRLFPKENKKNLTLFKKRAGSSHLRQGCQMVSFQTKNSNLGIFSGHLDFVYVCFMGICIFFPLWYIVPLTNLAALVSDMLIFFHFNADCRDQGITYNPFSPSFQKCK
jgi:hypothetical protein